jgi:hypothetical protein
MKNTESTPKHWVSILSGLPELPFAEQLKVHFDAGAVSRLCDCGCNSFDIKIPDGALLKPLCPPTSSEGKFFELVASNSDEQEIAFLFFVDRRGYLSGIDVTHGSGNHAPLPANTTIDKVLYTL